MIAWLTCAVVTGALGQSTSYHMEDLLYVGAGMIEARDVNNLGHVVGWSQSRKAVMYDGRDIMEFGTLTGTWSKGEAINDAGVIVGQFSWLDGAHGVQYGAFMIDSNQFDMGTLGGPESYAYDVSEAGVACGWSEMSNNWRRAFMYDGTMHDLGALTGGSISYGYGMNDYGVVVGASQATGGTRACRFESGGVDDLGTLGGTLSQAHAINNAGVIVGQSNMPGNTYVHAFVYRNNQMEDLGALGGYSFGSAAWDINGAGQIVGDSVTGLGANHAFLVGTDGVMRDLNSLRPSNVGYTHAFGINEAGWIVGRGAISVGTVRAYLLIPYQVPRGDFDSSGEVDLGDFQQFLDCFCGPDGVISPSATGVTPAHCISAFDTEFDRDIDLADFTQFAANFGP